MEIVDMAVCSSSSTFYALTTDDIRKWTGGSTSYQTLAVPNNIFRPLRFIAVAPGDSNIIALVDGGYLGNNVWISTDGGINYTHHGTPVLRPGIITDIALVPYPRHDIAYPQNDTVNGCFVAVANTASSSTAAAYVMVHNASMTWTSVLGTHGTYEYLAVAVSPNFDSDQCLCALGIKKGTGRNQSKYYIDFQYFNMMTHLPEKPVALAVTGPASDYADPSLPTSLVSAEIALPPDFLYSDPMNRRAFVSLATNIPQPTDGIYRIIDTKATKISPPGTIAFRSVDCSDDFVLVGEYSTGKIWRTSDPWRRVPPWSPSATLLGATKTVVRVGGGLNCLAGTSGNGSNLYRSTDGGVHFN